MNAKDSTVRILWSIPNDPANISPFGDTLAERVASSSWAKMFGHSIKRTWGLSHPVSSRSPRKFPFKIFNS